MANLQPSRRAKGRMADHHDQHQQHKRYAVDRIGQGEPDPEIDQR